MTEIKERSPLAITRMTDTWMESFLRSRTHDYEHDGVIACKEKCLKLAWDPVKQMCPHIQETEFSADEMIMIAEFIWAASRQGVSDVYGHIDVLNYKNVDTGKAPLLVAKHLLPIINFVNNKWIVQNMSPAEPPIVRGAEAIRGQIQETLS